MFLGSQRIHRIVLFSIFKGMQINALNSCVIQLKQGNDEVLLIADSQALSVSLILHDGRRVLVATNASLRPLEQHVHSVGGMAQLDALTKLSLLVPENPKQEPVAGDGLVARHAAKQLVVELLQFR